MCDGVTEVLAIAGVALSAVGAGVSYSQGQAAASAAQQAQNEAQANQNMQFNARLAGERQQVADQTTANTRAQAQFTQNQADQQNAQISAMDDRRRTIDQFNTQTQADADQRDKAVSQGLAPVTGTGLQDAQSAQAAQQVALNQPNVDNIAVSNPLGTGGSAITNEAISRGSKGAADYVDNYGRTLAQLSSYQAPLNTANTAATTIGTNLMPAAAAEQLVRAGTPALLDPSSTAYRNAGQYGTAVNTANTLANQGLTNLAANRASNTTDLANLTQQDNAAGIQGRLNIAQANAAAGAAMGNGLSSLGNAATQFGFSRGAFSDQINKVLPTTTPKKAIS